jgi:hypothetical protein
MLSNNDSHKSGLDRGWVGLVALVIGSVLLLFVAAAVITFVGGVLSDEPTDDVVGFVIATGIFLVPGAFLVRWGRRRRRTARNAQTDDKAPNSISYRRLRASVIIVLSLAAFGGMALVLGGLAALARSELSFQVPEFAVRPLVVGLILILLAPFFLFVFAFFPKWTEANLRKGRQGRTSRFESAALRLSEHPAFLWWSYVAYILALYVVGGLLIGLSSS